MTNLVAPLGMLILTYGYARYRTRFWFGLILGLMFAQLVIGFVTDIRGQALMPPLMVIVALTLVDNKLPKGWLLISHPDRIYRSIRHVTWHGPLKQGMPICWHGRKPG